MVEVFCQCLVSGFRHILPDGPDHVLFVLGLFLVCRDLASVLWQVTLFTLSHSLTLGLALCGLVSVPEKPVEILIALSIALIAVENLFLTGWGRWRPLMIVIFGLVHGLGFAGAFIESGVPLEHPVLALVSLNLGVELGQIAVITAACLGLGSFWSRPWYRRVVTLPGSLLVAGMGFFWAAMRIFSPG